MSEYKFHVGLAPYADQSGTVRASYQVVGIDTGKAVATLSMVDGKVTQSIFGDGNYCRGSFIAMAKRHFSTATPNPDYRPAGARCPDWACNEH